MYVRDEWSGLADLLMNLIEKYAMELENGSDEEPETDLKTTVEKQAVA